MKRIFSLLLAILLCALPLVGCKLAVKVDLIGGVSLAGFSESLDREGIKPGIEQLEAEGFMTKYGYPVYVENPGGGQGCIIDYDNGYSYSCNNEYFGYYYEWRSVNEKEQWSVGINAKIEMIGLALPYEIAFGDTLDDFFVKLRVEEDRREALVATLTAMPADCDTALFDNNNTKLFAVRYIDKDGGVLHKITYLEIDSAISAEGFPLSVTRDVVMSFWQGELCSVSWSVTEIG